MGLELSRPDRFRQIRDKLVFLARYKYRIRPEDALDIFQTAVAAWLEVRERYEGEKNEIGIFLGIFQNKCLEFIDASVRERKKLRELSEKPPEEIGRPTPGGNGGGTFPSTLAELIRREDGRLIVSALAELRPEAREMFRLLAEEDLGRKGLLERYRINRNTLDTRLRLFRRELRALLRRKGIYI